MVKIHVLIPSLSAFLARTWILGVNFLLNSCQYSWVHHFLRHHIYQRSLIEKKISSRLSFFKAFKKAVMFNNLKKYLLTVIKTIMVIDAIIFSTSETGYPEIKNRVKTIKSINKIRFPGHLHWLHTVWT